MGLRDLAKQVLVEQQNRRYEKLLAQKQTTYAQWTQRRMLFSEGESKIISADYQVFSSENGRLSADAGIKIDCYFKENPHILIAYGDEDVWGKNAEPSSPWFKPDWSPDVFKHHFYFGNLVIVRKSLLTQVERGECSLEEWIYQCVQAVGGFEKSSKAIGHISEVLFHNDTLESMMKNVNPYVASSHGENSDSSSNVDEGIEESANASARDMLMQTDTCPQLSIVIPTKDHPAVLEICIQSIVANCEEIAYEVIVVDNGSNDENKALIEALLESVSTPEHPIYYIHHPMEFHFSKMCNLGARAAKGEVLFFLNDDVELCQESGIKQMLENAKCAYTGAVGMKLYYPESKRIQHAGIVNLPMGPVHKLQFMEDEQEYYFDSNRCPKNVIAVTAACLMIEKAKFLEAGEFPMDLRVAFNDVSLCFRLFELGYHNVCRNDLCAYHHESLSRGGDESAEKLERLMQERAVLYQKHPSLQGYDPYYSVHFSREGLDTRIRPIYETCRNNTQKIKQTLTIAALEDAREDQCLLVRVESFIDNRLQGYSVVLGDNNACYDMFVLFQDEEGRAYQLPIEGQYRPDLVENMPDQVNVGLCGFHIDMEKTSAKEQNTTAVPNGMSGLSGLNKGHYRVGALARNRVGSLALCNWSNRYIDI